MPTPDNYQPGDLFYELAFELERRGRTLRIEYNDGVETLIITRPDGVELQTSRPSQVNLLCDHVWGVNIAGIQRCDRCRQWRNTPVM